MAKIKVHEIAKEFDKQSKDIISFLQEKGVVKTASSGLEDAEVAMVREAFGGKKAEAPKSAAPKTEAPKTEAPKTEETKVAPKAEASKDTDADAKKKKRQRLRSTH